MTLHARWTVLPNKRCNLDALRIRFVFVGARIRFHRQGVSKAQCMWNTNLTSKGSDLLFTQSLWWWPRKTRKRLQRFLQSLLSHWNLRFVVRLPNIINYHSKSAHSTALKGDVVESTQMFAIIRKMQSSLVLIVGKTLPNESMQFSHNILKLARVC